MKKKPHNKMRTKTLTQIRKKAEARVDNVRFQRAVRAAKERAAMRTEHAAMHNLLYQQIAPALRERVLNKTMDLARNLA